MSDADLRDLERRWKESGGHDDAVRYLQSRLRASDLPRERVEVAAWLGHPAACAVLGDDAPSGIAPWDLRACVEALGRWGAPWVVRGAAGVLERAFPLMEDRTDPRWVAGVRTTLEAVRNVLACPCAEHRRAAHAAAGEASDTARAIEASIGDKAIERRDPFYGRWPEGGIFLEIAVAAARTASAGAHTEQAPLADVIEDALMAAFAVARALQASVDSDCPTPGWTALLGRRAGPSAARAAVRVALGAALVEWALG